MAKPQSRMDRIEGEIILIKNRIFNGMAKEIRGEVDKSISGLRTLIVGFLISLVLAFAGMIVEGRFSSAAASEENMKNYRAIVDLQMQVEEIQDCIGQ